RRNRLLGLAAQIDSNGWRRQLRNILVHPNRAALEALVRRPETLTQPPLVLILCARALGRDNRTAALDLLRKAQRHYPSDFWLNYNLASYLYTVRPARPAEATGFLRAALAVRPNSTLAHGNLGYTLGMQGRYAEAEAEYRQVVNAQPDNVLA